MLGSIARLATAFWQFLIGKLPLPLHCYRLCVSASMSVCLCSCVCACVHVCVLVFMCGQLGGVLQYLSMPSKRK
jgi:hypothetical protein